MGLFYGESDIPPLQLEYGELLKRGDLRDEATRATFESKSCDGELPLIDAGRLLGGDATERNKYANDMAMAAREWGFFQLINHEVPSNVIHKIQVEQKKMFNLPFEVKLNMDCYKWGTTVAKQFCWMEAFHLPLDHSHRLYQFASTFRTAIEDYRQAMGELAQKLVGILAEKLSTESSIPASAYFRTHCTYDTSTLRLNRYPECTVPSPVLGLVSHTDSDFLTILHQDQVGGLEIMKDCKWVSVKPRPDALIVNIGDLLQAWSNDVYRSVQHRAIANNKRQRMSIAFFMCPSQDTFITKYDSHSHSSPPQHYRPFTFRDFKAQVNEDVRLTGNKVGLPRFRLY